MVVEKFMDDKNLAEPGELNKKHMSRRVLLSYMQEVFESRPQNDVKFQFHVSLIQCQLLMSRKLRRGTIFGR